MSNPLNRQMLEAAGFSVAADNWAADDGIAGLIPIGAAIGDSITVPNYNGSDKVNPSPPTNKLKNAKGYVTWALALSGQRVEIPPETNIWGWPSRETSEILAALPAFLAQMPRKPGFLIVECGTNNIGHDVSATGVGSFESITADWLAIATYLTQRGIRVIFVPILPRGPGFSSLFGSPQFDAMDRANRWLHTLAARSSGVIAVASECLAPMTDPSKVGAQPLAEMTGDGTHPETLGGYYIGKAIARILNTWFPPIDILPTNQLAWNFGINNANFSPNPMMQGAGGSVTAPSSGTISGTAPGSSTASMSNTAGLTVAHSQVTSAISGRPMHQMVFGGSYTVSGVTSDAWQPWGRLYQSASSGAVATLAAGDKLEAFIAFEIDAGHNCFVFPQLEMRWKSSARYNTDMSNPTPLGVLPNEQIVGVLRTPVHTYASEHFPLSAGDVAISVRAYLRAENGTYNPSGTIRFGRALIRRF